MNTSRAIGYCRAAIAFFLIVNSPGQPAARLLSRLEGNPVGRSADRSSAGSVAGNRIDIRLRCSSARAQRRRGGVR